MKYDIMFVGPATRDHNIDYQGEEVRDIGGAVYFCAYAARAAQAQVFSSMNISPEDADILDAFDFPRESLALLPSARTTLMRNTYFSADRERRRAECLAQSDPVQPEEIPEADCRLYHLCGLLYGDFPGELIPALKKRGMVSADAQGFLRHNEGGSMNFHDWADKKTFLPMLDFLKTDAAEAEVLTGLSDRRAAAKQLFDWGSRETMISHNAEMLVYDGSTFYTSPVKARNLSGRTGRGDTTFAGYLSRRLLGDDIPTALEYAAALVSLKMEQPGPFRGTDADVRAYIDEFYR